MSSIDYSHLPLVLPTLFPTAHWRHLHTDTLEDDPTSSHWSCTWLSSGDMRPGTYNHAEGQPTTCRRASAYWSDVHPSWSWLTSSPVIAWWLSWSLTQALGFILASADNRSQDFHLFLCEGGYNSICVSLLANSLIAIVSWSRLVAQRIHISPPAELLTAR